MCYVQVDNKSSNRILKPLFLIKDPSNSIILLFLEKCD
jgi:hypothetical protein